MTSIRAGLGAESQQFGASPGGLWVEAPPPEGLGRRVQRGLRQGRGFARMRWVPRARRFSEEGVGSGLCGGVERPGRSRRGQ